MKKLLIGIVVVLAVSQFVSAVENNDPTQELLSHITNTLWQWDGTRGETVLFQENGYVEHGGWTQRGLVTRWEVIDRRTVLLKIERGRTRDLYAILIFKEDMSSFEGFNFHGGSKLRVSQKVSEETRITIETMPPSVVKTVPQAGDTAVDPSLKEIHVTFSKDMLTDQMWAVCQISKETFPKTGKNIHYLKDKRTCVIPVELEPDKTYVLWFNKGRFNSFRDIQNNPAVPYLQVFRTKKGN